MNERKVDCEIWVENGKSGRRVKTMTERTAATVYEEYLKADRATTALMNKPGPRTTKDRAKVEGAMAQEARLIREYKALYYTEEVGQ